MGNTPNKEVTGEVEEDNKYDYKGALDSLPTPQVLQSVRKPRGQKGRKPPSKTFFENIISTLFHNSTTNEVTKSIETTEPNEKSKPSVQVKPAEDVSNIDLNVIEKSEVLHNVTKGRPARPAARKRGGGRPMNKSRRPSSAVTDSETVDLTIKKVTEKKQPNTKIFIKPKIERKGSRWKTIGIRKTSTESPLVGGGPREEYCSEKNNDEILPYTESKECDQVVGNQYSDTESNHQPNNKRISQMSAEQKDEEQYNNIYDIDERFPDRNSEHVINNNDSDKSSYLNNHKVEVEIEDHINGSAKPIKLHVLEKPPRPSLNKIKEISSSPTDEIKQPVSLLTEKLVQSQTEDNNESELVTMNSSISKEGRKDQQPSLENIGRRMTSAQKEPGNIDTRRRFNTESGVALLTIDNNNDIIKGKTNMEIVTSTMEKEKKKPPTPSASKKPWQNKSPLIQLTKYDERNDNPGLNPPYTTQEIKFDDLGYNSEQTKHSQQSIVTLNRSQSSVEQVNRSNKTRRRFMTEPEVTLLAIKESNQQEDLGKFTPAVKNKPPPPPPQTRLDSYVSENNESNDDTSICVSPTQNKTSFLKDLNEKLQIKPIPLGQRTPYKEGRTLSVEPISEDISGKMSSADDQTNTPLESSQNQCPDTTQNKDQSSQAPKPGLKPKPELPLQSKKPLGNLHIKNSSMEGTKERSKSKELINSPEIQNKKTKSKGFNLKEKLFGKKKQKNKPKQVEVDFYHSEDDQSASVHIKVDDNMDIETHMTDDKAQLSQEPEDEDLPFEITQSSSDQKEVVNDVEEENKVIHPEPHIDFRKQMFNPNIMNELNLKLKVKKEPLHPIESGSGAIADKNISNPSYGCGIKEDDSINTKILQQESKENPSQEKNIASIEGRRDDDINQMSPFSSDKNEDGVKSEIILRNKAVSLPHNTDNLLDLETLGLESGKGKHNTFDFTLNSGTINKTSLDKLNEHFLNLSPKYSTTEPRVEINIKDAEIIPEPLSNVDLSATNDDLIKQAKRKKSTQSVALEDAFNILNFELEDEDTPSEIDIRGFLDVPQQKYLNNSSQAKRKKSTQSIALEDAFNILDFELDEGDMIVGDIEHEGHKVNELTITEVDELEEDVSLYSEDEESYNIHS